MDYPFMVGDRVTWSLDFNKPWHVDAIIIEEQIGGRYLLRATRTQPYGVWADTFYARQAAHH
jgi:hypothetical protein